MKYFSLVIVVLTGALLIAVTADFPVWGDPYSPASTHVSPYYITNAYKDVKTPNIVTTVLGDYRGFDTMLETAVVLIAGIAIMLLLRRSPLGSEPVFPEGITHHEQNTIVQITCRLLIPPMQLYALYVVAHGHYSPGGGFQGGVVLGSTLILHSLAFGLGKTAQLFSERMVLVCTCAGVFIYAGIGLLCLLLGGNFLDYGELTALLPVVAAEARSLGVLGIETGVAITVMAVMFSIYADLSSKGQFHKGL